VNPRYTASMELVDWAFGLNVFALHLEAMQGILPEFRLALEPVTAYYGKAVVFADTGQLMPQTTDWLSKGRRDIPSQGERIQRWHPICTVLAQGKTHRQCWDALLGAADSVRVDISEGGRATKCTKS